MKFKEMRTEQKVLFITNIILTICAVGLFLLGLFARANSSLITQEMYKNVEIGRELLATGINKSDTTLLVTNIFGVICGIAVIYGILSYVGINAEKNNKPKVALIIFSILAVICLLLGGLSLGLILIVISIICLVIMLNANKKETTITNE